MSIAREGWPYILALVAVAAVAWFLQWPWVAGVLVALGVFVAFFFRDPTRIAPDGPQLVLAPGDGKIVRVVPAAAEGSEGPQLSIFLSIFNVHINRAPIAGRVTAVDYNKGAFLPAFDDKASLKNEQNRVTIEGAAGTVAFTQIAGLIARRIVCRKRPGDSVTAGERVGLIKFGSRVDVFLPPGAVLRVARGDRVAGGETVIAELPEPSGD